MRSRNPVYPLPQGAFSVHINAQLAELRYNDVIIT